ncbi:hypothetical protein AX15_003544 [Amanita polypyramis BW_CC]|nr:hypothetical protein AX15_003544 [Amanita polypyramis BW_CC]
MLTRRPLLVFAHSIATQARAIFRASPVAVSWTPCRSVLGSSSRRTLARPPTTRQKSNSHDSIRHEKSESLLDSTATQPESSVWSVVHYDHKPLEHIKLFRRLDWILRYGVGYKHVDVRPDGFVLVKDILALHKFHEYDMRSFRRLLRRDDLKKFELRNEPYSQSDVRQWFVRLAKGKMKIPVEGVDRGNKKILFIEHLPQVAQCTLTQDVWLSASHHGISRGADGLIHLHPVRPNALEIDYGSSCCVILLDVDVHAAFSAGISFYIARNDDIVTEGDVDGIIPPIYFRKAVKVECERQQLV